MQLVDYQLRIITPIHQNVSSHAFEIPSLLYDVFYIRLKQKKSFGSCS